MRPAHPTEFAPALALALSLALLLPSAAMAAPGALETRSTPTGCETGVPFSTIDALLRSQEISFESLELDSFQVSFSQMQGQLSCVNERISTADAARIHRMTGIALFTEKKNDQAARAFAAARLLDPAWTFPASIPEGIALRKVWEGSLAEQKTDVVAIGLPGNWVVDGVVSTRRPSGWPALLQEERRGAIYSTQYLPPGQQPAQATPPRSPATTPLAIAAGATALGGITTLVIAGINHGSFDNERHTAGELAELQTRTNSFGGTGVGLGLLAVGLGVGCVLTVDWK